MTATVGVVTPTHKTLAAALAAFQAELPTIKKDNTAQVASAKGSYSYQYADLADISPVVLPLLGKHGLAWSTRPTMVDHEFVLAYSLTHAEGEALEGVYPLPSANTPAQALGSAITYARRYALCAVTGVAPGGDDDDAASAPSAPERPKRTAPARPPQTPPARPSAPAYEERVREWVIRAMDIKNRPAMVALGGEAKQAGVLPLPIDPPKDGEQVTTLNDLLMRRLASLPDTDDVPADPYTGEVAEGEWH